MLLSNIYCIVVLYCCIVYPVVFSVMMYCCIVYLVVFSIMMYCCIVLLYCLSGSVLYYDVLLYYCCLLCSNSWAEDTDVTTIEMMIVRKIQVIVRWQEMTNETWREILGVNNMTNF